MFFIQESGTKGYAQNLKGDINAFIFSFRQWNKIALDDSLYSVDIIYTMQVRHQ